jgi:predicted metalloprotease with PDZ domain
VDDIRSLVAHEYFHNWSGAQPKHSVCTYTGSRSFS